MCYYFFYEYDVFRQNTAVYGNDFIQRNRYDVEGYRYEAEENGTTNRFVYHDGMPLAELDEENIPKAGQYLGNGFLGGRLRKKKDPLQLKVPQTDEKDRTPTIPTISTIPTVPSKPELCYYIGDEQGSIRYVIGEDGTVGNRYRYDAFGVAEETEEMYGNRLRYNGQIYDELTEQYYLRARYYQPQLGRFTQEDLLFADGLNLYAYCENNPVMYKDPSGLAEENSCWTKRQAENGNNKGEIYSGDLMSAEDAAAYSEHWRELGIGSDKTWNEFKAANPSGTIDDYFDIVQKQSPWPLKKTGMSTTLKTGDRFFMAVENDAPESMIGGFGVKERIESTDFVRNNLAVKYNWKTSCNVIREFEVNSGVKLKVNAGPIGPQIDLGANIYLPGDMNITQYDLFSNLGSGINRQDYIHIIDEYWVD